MTITVYEVTVEFRRRVTPKEYEHAEAFGRLSAQVDGTDVVGALDTLLSTAKSAVLTHVGFQPGRDTVKAEAEPKAEPQPQPKPQPKPAAQLKPKAEPKPEPKAEPADDDAFLNDIGGQENAPPAEVDDKTLITEAQSAAERGGPAAVKAVMKQYDVGKLRDLAPGDRFRFVQDLRKIKG